jgi:type IV secretion system protein VirD4
MLSFAPQLNGRIITLAAPRGLGRPLAHIYQPFAWWWWQARYPHAVVQIGRSVIALQPLWRWCENVVLYPLAGLGVVLGLISAVLVKWRGTADLYGSASWACRPDIKRAGLLSDNGIYLATWNGRELLKDEGQGHVCVIAPTRSGKGVGVVVPTLLTWAHSVVVMDIKGENFQLSAGRRKQLGNVVLKFDPTAEGSCCFNPFDEVPLRTADEWGEIDNIATSLLDPRGRGAAMDSHWDRQGVGWVGAAICHLLYAEQDKTLRGLAHLIAGLGSDAAGKGIMETIKRIRDTNHTGFGPHPDVAREMQMMLDKSPNERSGIISTVQGFLKIYRDPRIAAATSRSDFRISDLMNYERSVSRHRLHL